MRVARSENSAYAKLLRGALCHIQRFEIVVLLTSYNKHRKVEVRLKKLHEIQIRVKNFYEFL